MATATASQDFDEPSSQSIRYNSASDGPHKDVTYPFTFVAWCLPENVITNLGLMSCGGSSDTFVQIGIDDSTNDWEGRIRTTAAGFNAQDFANFTEGSWCFLVFEIIAADDRQLYIDNVQSGSTWTDSRDVVAEISNMTDTTVGVYLGVGSVDYWNGQVAHCRIFNKQLSDAELAALRWNPWAVNDSVLWAPDMQVSASAQSDYIDRSGKGYTPNSGTIGSSSALGGLVHFYGGG